MSKDKRKSHRYPILATALIKVKHERETNLFESLIANISQSGLGVYSYVPIENGTPVSIEITFISIKGFEQKDDIEGKIVHLSKLGKLYYLGIAFNRELTPETHPFLYKSFLEIVSWD